MPKPGQDVSTKDSYRLISVMNIVTKKISMKYLKTKLKGSFSHASSPSNAMSSNPSTTKNK
jgi:hypothetical protein